MRLTVATAALLWSGVAVTNAAPAGATSAVTIQGFAYQPATLAVTAGDSVTWTNRDAASHTVTFQSGGGSGTLTTGAAFTFTFAAAGTIAYHCSIHPSMTGTVVVRAAATPPPTVAPTPAPASVPPPAGTPEPVATAVPATAAPAQAATGTPGGEPSATVAPSPSTATSTLAPAASASAVLALATASAATPAPPGAPAVAIAAVILIGLAGTAAWVLRRR